MMLLTRSLVLRSLVLAAVLFGLGTHSSAQSPAPAPAEAPNSLKNPDFTEGPLDTAPAGWEHRTKTTGYVKTVSEANQTFVRIGVNNAGESSFIQQIIPLSPEAARVRIAVTSRHRNIDGGEKGHETGVIQARFTKDGKEFGRWIDLGKLEGTSEEWTDRKRSAEVDPKVAPDGIMLRLALYGVKSGELDVLKASVAVLDKQQLAAATAIALKSHRGMEPYGQRPSDARFARLAKGININNWFGQPYNAKDLPDGRKGAFTAEHFRSYITDEELGKLRAIGLTNIRLPIEVAAFMDIKTGDINPELLPELDHAISRMVAAGLAVQVDFHPKEKRVDAFHERPELAELYVKWIGQISAHLAKTTDPEFVFIELLNEPGGLGMYGNTWQIYQDRLINEVRRNAPEHTIIGNAGGYMLWRDTIKHTPHPDRNVIYAFHYYEPGQFTHQGARWMKPMYQPLRNVPWPLTEENLQQAIDGIVRKGWKDKLADADKQAEAFLRNGVKEGFGTPAKMDETMGAVVAWAKQHNVQVIVNEFGVFKPYVKQEDRVRYLKDVVQAMERHGFGWTMWEYAHEFGFASGTPGKRAWEADTLGAMGLGTGAASTPQ